MEGLVVARENLRHGLSADGNTDLDGALSNGIGDVLGGLEAGGAEAVYGGSTRGVGDSGSEGGGTDDVSGPAVVDLVSVRSRASYECQHS